MASGEPEEDGYNWRRYGQRPIKGREYPRCYYRCTHPTCEVKKRVDRNGEGHICDVVYIGGSHNHPQPPPNRPSGIGSSGTNLDMQIDGTEQTEQEDPAETDDDQDEDEDEDEPESKRRKREGSIEEYMTDDDGSSMDMDVDDTLADADFFNNFEDDFDDTDIN